MYICNFTSNKFNADCTENLHKMEHKMEKTIRHLRIWCLSL